MLKGYQQYQELSKILGFKPERDEANLEVVFGKISINPGKFDDQLAEHNPEEYDINNMSIKEFVIQKYGQRAFDLIERLC